MDSDSPTSDLMPASRGMVFIASLVILISLTEATLVPSLPPRGPHVDHLTIEGLPGKANSQGIEDQLRASTLVPPNTWQKLYAGPSARWRFGAASGIVGNTTVIFGGQTQAGRDGETWALDLETWTWRNETASTGPSPRSSPALAHHPPTGLTVLFGGSPEEGWDNETWLYDPTTAEWLNVTPANSPTARYGHTMAYLDVSELILLFGGATEAGTANDTWVYDPLANTWTEVETASAPPTRVSHAMAYDSSDHRIVVFGGCCETSGFLSDTWLYDPLNMTWTNVTMAVGPSGRWGHSLAYDVGTQGVILFGGTIIGGSSRETWTYDVFKNEWSNITGVVGPPARTGAALVPDTLGQRMVLFSGILEFGWSRGLWTFEPETRAWARVNPAPAPRDDSEFVYDADSERLVLFGGSQGSNETWNFGFANQTWEVTTTFASPAARRRHAMAYDEGSNRVVLFGGDVGGPGDPTPDSETWVFDEGNGTWVELTPPGSPSPRYWHSMGYDPQSRKMLLFGGRTPTGLSEETWEFDLPANTWVRLDTPTSPSPRSAHGMSYHAGERVFVLFGGFTGAAWSDETWIFDPAEGSWREMSPPTRPSPRSGHGMAYHAPTQRIVLFGGSPGPNGETWSYDLANDTWSRMEPVPAPQARWGHAMTFHPPSGSIVFFGGGQSDEIWGYSAPLVQPGAPRDLRATPGDGEVSLRWRLPSMDGGSPVTGHRVLRGTTPTNLSLLTVLANTTTYVDTWVTNGVTYYYGVRAVNGIGFSPSSNIVAATPTPPLDTEAPTVSILSPPEGAGLRPGPLTVEGTASDDQSLEKVEVRVDGGVWRRATGTTSWTVDVVLDSGEHTLHARAVDVAGNSAVTSTTLTVQSLWEEAAPALGILAATVIVGVIGYALFRRRVAT